MKNKICFVVQRYGKEVNGGAELHCKQLAEHMTQYYDVDIITTKAIDYITWNNEYKEDQDIINGVCVHRFAVDYPRDMERFNALSTDVLQLHSTKEEEIEWMKQQGPYSTALLEYIQEKKDEYCVFIFFTYLYCTTFFGLPLVHEKAILIPTAHDETPIYLSIFNEFFALPKGIFYNTKIEQQFIEHKFQNDNIYNNNGMGGVGVEIPEDISKERFIEKYRNKNFVIYIGRIDESKGCNTLFNYFQEYKLRNGGNLKLILLGKEILEIPECEDIVSLGFVDEQTKFDALAACKFLILPSQFESLSMVVLEAMSLEKPVLVNGDCEVVKNHCVISNGGLYYQNYFEFEGAMNYLLEHANEATMMGKNGKEYVDQNYKWDAIAERLRKMIEYVMTENI